MKVTQVYDILNTITRENLGESVVVNEDLSNVVEIGDEFQNVIGLDNYVKKLNDHIGRMVFVDRVYKGRGYNVLRDGWEFGSILEKVTAKMPDAEESEVWQLTDRASYDPNIFYQPEVSTKFYNQRVTFEIPMSFTEEQVKSSFSNGVQMNAFFSMIYTAIANSITVKTDSLISRTVNTLIGETVYDAFKGQPITGAGNTRAINLLARFNSKYSANLTAEQAITNADFIKFASYTMANFIDRLKVMSTLFNVGGTEKFTPQDRMNVIMLSEFKNAAGSYLNSDTFHDAYVALPNAETVPYWQGSGLDYDFASTSKIDIKMPDNNTQVVTGVLAVIMDRDACAVTNENPRVTSQYNAKAEFFNEWHRWTAGYLIDLNENALVFYVA